jgi:hypothetical protein
VLRQKQNKIDDLITLGNLANHAGRYIAGQIAQIFDGCLIPRLAAQTELDHFPRALRLFLPIFSPNVIRGPTTLEE